MVGGNILIIKENDVIGIPPEFTGTIMFVVRNNNHPEIWHYVEGKFHREDGPAVECADNRLNYNEWFQNDKMHRLYGPALDYPNEKKWYLEDKQYSAEEHFEIVFNISSKEQQIWMLFNLDLWR